MKYFINAVAYILIGIALCSLFSNKTPVIDGGTPWSDSCGLETNDIANMYSTYVDQWKEEISLAFDTAELQVFKSDPQPDIVVPLQDPDPQKCVCKGSGIIVHGDGHKTYCEYHGPKHKRMESNIKGKDLIIVKPIKILEE